MHNFITNPIHEQTIINVLKKAIQTHKRVSVFRFDLRFPGNAIHLQFDSSVITRFVESLKSKIHADVKRKSKKWGRNLNCTVNFVWVREVGSLYGNIHYHFLLFLPKDIYHSLGDFNFNDRALHSLIREAWVSALKTNHPDFMSLIYFDLTPSYLFDKYDLDMCIKGDANLERNIKYLAKIDTKDTSIGNTIGHSQY